MCAYIYIYMIDDRMFVFVSRLRLHHGLYFLPFFVKVLWFLWLSWTILCSLSEIFYLHTFVEIMWISSCQISYKLMRSLIYSSFSCLCVCVWCFRMDGLYVLRYQPMEKERKQEMRLVIL